MEDKNQKLELSRSFRDQLKNITGKEVPQHAWWAIDHHIDWLGSVMYLYEQNVSLQDLEANPPFLYTEKIAACMTATQQDFDFIIAFDDTIFLIEAKAGNAWSRKQFESKCKCVLFSLSI